MMKKMVAAAALVAAHLSGAHAEEPCTNESPCDPPPVGEGEWPTSIWHPDGGYIRLGVHDGGQLNFRDSDGVIGLRFIDHDGLIGAAGTEYESTSPGCLCEGWGAAYTHSATRESGHANQARGGLVGVAAAGMLHSDSGCMAAPGPSTCSFAETDATVGTCLRVQHNYTPSTKTKYAYKVDVIVTNQCADDITDLEYSRVMDWDIVPAAFSERVVINPGTAADLECVHDNGFCTGDPDQVGCNGINLSGCAPANVDTDTGVADHGSQFIFHFQDITPATPLTPGSTKTFTTYYGAHATEAQARDVMAQLGDVEAYSLGIYGGSGVGPTHFFAFAGVGGTVVTPPVTGGVTAPCDCQDTTASSDTSSVELRFSPEGPYNAVCA